MTGLFSGWKLGELAIPNRLVRSATWEGMALANGAPSDNLVEFYRGLAEGGVGLIITGYAYVTPDGIGFPKQTGIHDDAMIEPMSRLTAAVHEAGGIVALQIVHAGGQTRSGWIGGKGLGKNKSSHLASSFRRASADPGSQNPQRSKATPPVLLPRIDQISPKSEHDLGTIYIFRVP